MSSYNEPNIDRLLKTLKGEKADRVPNLELLLDNEAIYGVLGRKVEADSSLHMKPGDHVELARKIGMDAVGFGCVWEDFGRIYKNAKDGSKHYVDGFVKSWDDVKRLKPPSLNPLKEKIEMYLEELDGTNIGLWVYVHGPFDSAYLAMGYQDFSLALYDDMKLVEHLMDMATDFYSNAAREICKYPIAFLWVADDSAVKDSMMCRPDLYRKLWVERTRKIIAPAVEKKIPIIHHSDGDLKDLIPIMLEVGGANAIHPIEPAGGNDIYAIKEQYTDQLTLCGNIDISGVLSYGTKEEVVEDVKEHIDRLSYNGRYICTSSNSITDSVKTENFMAMIETVHKYGRF